jgi:PAS domain S-box-containing protein
MNRKEGLMHWQFTLYIFPLLVSAAILTALAFSAWHHRAASGAVSFFLLALVLAEWSLTYALELMSNELSIALLWNDLVWLGASSAPTLWLVFVLQYTGRIRWLTRRNLAILSVEPLITLLLLWTSPFQGLMESHFRLNTSTSISILEITPGVWYWVHIVYSYCAILFSAVLICMLIQTLLRSARLYLGQTGALLVGMFAPWAGNILTLLGLNPFPRLDLTPFAFTFGGLAAAWSLFRFRLFDILPVAREIVFENISDAVIVVDEQNRIVDLNCAAQDLAHHTASKVVGQPFNQVFASWPELVACYDQTRGASAEIVRSEGTQLRYFNLSISSVNQLDPLATGERLVLLNDMTKHKQAESLLRESEERFRRIFEEAPIGMALVDRDDRLLQVNKAFCKMLGYEDQELMGFKLTDLVHPDDLEKDGSLVSQVLQDDMSSSKIEKRYLKRNREILWADVTVTLLQNNEGQNSYRLMMFENVIERKRAKLLEVERNHVAYELHDGLAQVTVSAYQHLQAFANHYHPRSPQAHKELNRALELVQHSVREARRLIAGLRPTVLDEFGLVTALHLLVEAQRAEGWTLSYDETLGSERLSPMIEATLLGVAQEALTNVRKHAHTTKARLILERQATHVCLAVQDWGCGFEPMAAFHKTGLGEHVGLSEMQERVELVGGHLTIFSQPGVGTLLVAQVPLPLSANRSLTFEEGTIVEAQAKSGAISNCR